MKLTRLPVCFLSLFTTVTMLIGVKKKKKIQTISFFLFKKQNQNQNQKKNYPEGGHCYKTEGMT